MVVLSRFCRIALIYSGSSAPTGASPGLVWSHVVQGKNIAECFSDLLSAIRNLSEDKGVGVHHDIYAMMCKVDAIFERLGLGTHESMISIPDVRGTSMSDDSVDEVETRSLAEFSSLSSIARELLEILASSGLSSDGKRELGEKIHRIWSGWHVRIEDVEFETTNRGFRKKIGRRRFLNGLQRAIDAKMFERGNGRRAVVGCIQALEN